LTKPSHGRHREENANVALFFPHEYPSTSSGQACGENKRHGFLKEYVEREEWDYAEGDIHGLFCG
jgi:hypothetical protein